MSARPVIQGMVIFAVISTNVRRSVLVQPIPSARMPREATSARASPAIPGPRDLVLTKTNV